MIRRFKKKHTDWSEFPNKNSIQLNDTHPAIATVELLRILIDIEKLPWQQAWQIVYKTFSYTNHTVLPEALEKWSVQLFEHLLPRHLDLIYLINHIFLEQVKKKWPNDGHKCMELSLIEEGYPKKIRMANLSIVTSHAVNGVAAIHSELVKSMLFPTFNEFYPGKISNKTNGVTPRRWIYCCNPLLSQLITDTLGDNEWILNLGLLTELKAWKND